MLRATPIIFHFRQTVMSGRAKVQRYKVQCKLCKEYFDNDNVRRHTQHKHEDLAAQNRLAPVLLQPPPEGQELRKDPFTILMKRAGPKRPSMIDINEEPTKLQRTENDNNATPLQRQIGECHVFQRVYY